MIGCVYLSSTIYAVRELAYNEASNRAAFRQMTTTQTKENSWLRWQLTRGVQQLWSRLPWRRCCLAAFAYAEGFDNNSGDESSFINPS